MSQDVHEEGQKAVETAGESSPTHEEPTTSEQDSDLSKNVDEVDYKALYEQELSTRQKAEEKIIKLKKKQKAVSVIHDDEDEEEETAVDVSELVSREVQKQTQAVVLNQLISKYTSNPDKQNLIKLHLDTIKSSGDLATDVRRAVLIADEQVYSKMTEEQKARALSDISTSQGASSGSEMPTKKIDTVSAISERAKQTAIKNVPPRYQKAFNK